MQTKKALLKKLAQKQGAWECHYCHLPVVIAPLSQMQALISQGYGIATVDHMEAKFNGGDDNLDNLVLACFNCNQEKGVKSYENYYKKTHKRRLKRIGKRQ